MAVLISSFATGLGVGFASLAGLALLAAAGVGVYYTSFPHPIHPNGSPGLLEV